MPHARRIRATGVLALAATALLAAEPAFVQSAVEAGDKAASSDGLERVPVNAMRLMPPLDIASENQVAAADSSLEQVTVRGQRSMLSYRVEIDAARDHIFDVFNALNSDDAFDITCRYERPTGTRIPERRCRPAFLKEATADAAGAYLDALFFEDGGEAAMSQAMVANSRARTMHEELVEEMERLVVEHPELAAAFVEYFELQDAYREAREQRGD